MTSENKAILLSNHSTWLDNLSNILIISAKGRNTESIPHTHKILQLCRIQTFIYSVVNRLDSLNP